MTLENKVDLYTKRKNRNPDNFLSIAKEIVHERVVRVHCVKRINTEKCLLANIRERDVIVALCERAIETRKKKGTIQTLKNKSNEFLLKMEELMVRL